MKKTVLIIVVALAGLAGGIYLSQWQSSQSSIKKEPPVMTAPPVMRPQFKLKDTEGQLRDIKEWDGKVIMINFWATWCPPCRREMPALMQLHETYKDQNFIIIGIALDEKQNVIDYVDPMGIEYPILIGDEDGIYLTKEYGNRLGVLPYTVVIDRQGKIVYRHRNEISFTMAEQVIKPLL